MTRLLTRTISAAAVAAMSGALLLAGTVPASAFDAGPLASVVNGTDPSWATGSNFDTVQLTAPAPCDAAATRHVTKIVAVTAADPADQPLADAWVGDNLYATASYGLPGPLTVKSNNSWQGMADTFSQQLVPANYEFVLRCQNNLGSVIYEEWSGGVTFDSPTHWAPNALPDSRVATTTALTAAPQPVTAGENATLTATVSESAASDPTGNVEFFNGATSLGTAAVDPATGVATLVGPLAAGTYNFTATYAGDTTFQPSTGAATPGFVVSAAPAAATTTAVTAAPQPVAADEQVTLTATVSETDPATPTGTVEFLSGTTSLGSATLDGSGIATLVRTLAAGTYDVTATYAGDATFEASAGAATPGFVVDPAAPKVETTTGVTAAPQPVTADADVTLTATVTESDPATPTGDVEFFSGTTSLGKATLGASGVATWVGKLVAGTYDITGVYSGDGTFATSTGAAPAGFVVAPAPGSGIVATQDGQPLGDNPTLSAGDEIKLTVSGFAAGESVTVTLASTPRTLAPETADAAGVVSYDFTVPADLEAGAHTLTFAGTVSENTQVFDFTVASSGSVAGSLGNLALTGSEMAVMSGLAVLLLAGGTGLVVFTRRRRAAIHPADGQ